MNQSRVGDAIAGLAVAISLILLSTGTRIFVKLFWPANDKLYLDDYLIVFATVVAVADCAVLLGLEIPHGLGRHISTVEYADLQRVLLAEFITGHLYNTALASIKLSILALYYRIFITETFRKIVVAVATFVVLWLITIEISIFFICRPLQSFWNPRLAGNCLNVTAMIYYITTSNLVTDLVVFVLPLPVIIRLHITRKNKVALSILFSIGILTCGISAARLTYAFIQKSPDITYDGVPFALLSTYEMLGGIMCANLPIIYKLLRRVFWGVRSAPSPEARSIPAEHSHGPFRHPENSDGDPGGWTPLSGNYYSHGNNYTTTVEAQPEAAQIGHNT
ncbi:uncharacterized protein BJX67DRAFT_359532 [Aspergillus lucknowensis]|uniref:Rhodopsin domain-containing protein n=1 Tax=Aspergillus lucknowensis TaxID=176173 RepID=A0ABR4LNJ3_9EURO